jgi:hypothetical protein
MIILQVLSEMMHVLEDEELEVQRSRMDSSVGHVGDTTGKPARNEARNHNKSSRLANLFECREFPIIKEK